MVRLMLATDLFDQGSIDAAWTEEGGGVTNFDVNSHDVYLFVQNGGGNRCIERGDISPAQRQYSQCTVHLESGSATQMGPTVLAQGDGRCYFIMARASGAWELGKMAANQSDSQLGLAPTPVGISYPITGLLELEADASTVPGTVTLLAYWTPSGGMRTLIATRTDSSSPYTSGAVGIFGNGGNENTYVQNWEGGNLDGGSVTIAPVTSLTCTRHLSVDNDLAWTKSGNATTYQVSRSATGASTPGTDGSSNGWTLIEDDTGDVAAYTDAAHARAYYAVRGKAGSDVSTWVTANNALTMTAISDLAVTRVGSDNKLDWTAPASASAVTQHVSRSPTGIGDPGTNGHELDWVVVSAVLDDDIVTYTDTGAARAFYRVRWVHSEGDLSAWSNVSGDVSGETPGAVWLSYPGKVLTSPSASFRLLVGANHNLADGGIDYLDVALTHAIGTTHIQVESEGYWRGNEIEGQTSPMGMVESGQQVAVKCFGLEVTANDYAEGPVVAVVTVVPSAGIPFVLPTYTFYNNKAGGYASPTVKICHVGSGGNDANTGQSFAQRKLTSQAAINLVATGGNVSDGYVYCHPGTLWNKASGTSTVTCTGDYWLTIMPAPGVTNATLGKDGDYANKPAFTPSAGVLNIRFAGWNSGNKLEGRIRSDVLGANVKVCYDHCDVVPHSPWAATSNPNVGAQDEGTTSLFYCVTGGDPNEIFHVGTYIHHMNGTLFGDPNSMFRGCRISTGYGIVWQVPALGNMRAASCQVDNWRHASVGVDGVFDATSTQLQALESPDRAGKLRVRSVLGQTVTAFATQAGLLATATTHGSQVIGFANAAGNNDPYVILAAGTDGSSRQWVDLDVSFFTEAAGNSVQLRTTRISDSTEWSTEKHSDVWKVDSVTPVNCLFQHIYQVNNGTPRGFGWDGGMVRCWFKSIASGLTGDNGTFHVRNDDFDQGTNNAQNSGWRRCSWVSDVNYDSGATFTKAEILQCVFEGLSASNRTTLANNVDMRENHFVDVGDACGSSQSTGTAFAASGVTPSINGDFRLDPVSTAKASATSILGAQDQWFTGDKGVEKPCLQGDFSIDDVVLDAISDLAAVRVGGTDNSLSWTPGVGANIHQVARSATGVGDPGANGTSGDWVLVADDLAGDADSYLDAGTATAYYRVRFLGNVDAVSAWSNRANTISGVGGSSRVILLLC